MGISLAHRFKLLDIPSPRRRHRQPTPTNGGICIFIAWALGMIVFAVMQPEWIHENAKSLTVLAASLAILIPLGLLDDIRGLSSTTKLIFQSAAAIIPIIFDPHVHGVCLAWQSMLGIAVWPMALLWIVGITNAVNLIDGLDGLAGGTSVLVCGSIAILSYWSGASAVFSLVVVSLLIPAVIGFLLFNWNPAKIFLGDNGSLSLGFIIATGSLMCKPGSHSWIMIPSIALMLGYPILDMGLAVFRRARSGLPLFKADRSHLHFRIQRLGLTTRQTAVLLLSISVYLQMTAICINLLPPAAGVLGLGLVTFSIFTLVFVVKCIELEKIRRIKSIPAKVAHLHLVGKNPVSQWVMNIELTPLHEVALLEERSRYPELVQCLESMLHSITAKEDEIVRNERSISVILSAKNTGDAQNSSRNKQEIRDHYAEKIRSFCQLVDLQCSLSTLPISFEKSDHLQSKKS